MTLLIWIVRILVLLILIRIVVRLLSANTGTPARSRSKPVERLGGALVRDPHCGTYVPKSRALTAGSGEATQYFCSAACRDAHLDADRFARAGHAP